MKVHMILESLPNSFSQLKINYNMNKLKLTSIDLMHKLDNAERFLMKQGSAYHAKSSSKPKGGAKVPIFVHLIPNVICSFGQIPTINQGGGGFQIRIIMISERLLNSSWYYIKSWESKFPHLWHKLYVYLTSDWIISINS